MKIVDNRKKNFVSFRNLRIGDIFIFDNEAYMKIPEVENDCKTYNSIHLTTGCLDSFCTNVELINNCELILKD